MLMHRIKIRRKGQMTLPAEIREDLELEEGDVIFLRKENGMYTLSAGESWANRTAGTLESNLPPLEPEELEEIIRDAVDSGMLEKFGELE